MRLDQNKVWEFAKENPFYMVLLVYLLVNGAVEVVRAIMAH